MLDATSSNLSYDSENGRFTYHDNSGRIKSSLDVGGFTVTAYDSNNQILSVTDTTSVHRQLTALEYVNILNTILDKNLDDSNIADWFPPSGMFDSAYFSSWNNSDSSFYVQTPGGDGWQSQNDQNNKGYISLKNYKFENELSLYTHDSTMNPEGTDIRIWADSNSYLDIQKLQYIGSPNDAMESVVYINNGENSDSSNSSYYKANIIIKNVDIINNSGSYSVYINNGVEETIQYSDINVVKIDFQNQG